MDERDLKLLAANDKVRTAILDSIPDENQRKLVEQVMSSPQWRMSEIVQRNSDLEKKIRRLQGTAAEGERATEESARLRSKLASAESALNAASRVAEKERFARISAEESRDELIAALRDANTQQSRLERLLDAHREEQ
jgi:tellurite resistance protein